MRQVEVVPVVHGFWENVRNGNGGIDFRCSACRRYRFHNGEMREKYKYCPNCGAKMDLGRGQISMFEEG
ncbi:MAG: hypothetical protein IJL39_05205 [Clostridia bacterium]|nr:hypothetical protein [Clostridia bacterium]